MKETMRRCGGYSQRGSILGRKVVEDDKNGRGNGQVRGSLCHFVNFLN
ncbi:hypothetical protein COLO4_36330 [Corchorus olitorius]|uniref:Uncharacterized protein n=1 Tax=Corchorus olitorius TaxID=93759 RepID=A0A1R3G9W4_9ROSI|nr:hypothetical protein COLO4_36330 [Corchorus olitorius]